MADFAADLLRAGREVHGLIQQWPAEGKHCATLINLRDGSRRPLFQNLGSGSVSCSVDAGSLAATSGVLRHALEAHAELAIANRFGPLEAAGGGFAAEMLALMAEVVPFLTIVAAEHQHLPAWRYFTGGTSVELPAERAALDMWFAAQTKELA